MAQSSTRAGNDHGEKRQKQRKNRNHDPNDNLVAEDTLRSIVGRRTPRSQRNGFDDAESVDVARVIPDRHIFALCELMRVETKADLVVLIG